jgi:hypothetical protein
MVAEKAQQEPRNVTNEAMVTKSQASDLPEVSIQLLKETKLEETIYQSMMLEYIFLE